MLLGCLNGLDQDDPQQKTPRETKKQETERERETERGSLYAPIVGS